VARMYAFDTGALSLHIEGDARVRPVMEEVARGAAEGIVTDLSLTELQYKLCRRVGAKAAEAEGNRIRRSPLRLVHSSPFLDMAWRLKCRYRDRFGLADCVLLAVAQVHACRILTTDSAFEGLKELRVSAKVFPVSQGRDPEGRKRQRTRSP